MTGTKICKICGKEYPYCLSAVKGDGVFRWQDIACCEEHGRQYFAAVNAARNGAKNVAQPAAKKSADEAVTAVADGNDAPKDNDGAKPKRGKTSK